MLKNIFKHINLQNLQENWDYFIDRLYSCLFGYEHKNLSAYIKSDSFALALILIVFFSYLYLGSAPLFLAFTIIILLIVDVVGYIFIFNLTKSAILHRALLVLSYAFVVMFLEQAVVVRNFFNEQFYRLGYPQSYPFFRFICHPEVYINEVVHVFVGVPLFLFFAIPFFLASRRLFAIGEWFDVKKNVIDNAEVLKVSIRDAFDRSQHYTNIGSNYRSILLYLFLLISLFGNLYAVNPKVGVFVYPLFFIFSAFEIIDVFYLFEWAAWTWVTYYFFISVFGFKNFKDLIDHFDSWLTLKREHDFTKATVTLVLLVLQPSYWLFSGGESLRSGVSAVVFNHLYGWTVFVKIILVVSLFSVLASSLRRDELSYVKSVYYFSCFISLYFTTLCVQYNWNIENNVFVPIFTRFELTSFLLTYSTEIFSFAYDYITLALCTMTSVVFSFVFLSVLFSDVQKKKVLFSVLLFLEFTIIFAFLSVNVLGFFIFFEATVVPTALLIYFWGSSPRKTWAAKQFVIYSIGSSIPLLMIIPYIYNVFGTLDYIFILNNLSILTYNEQVALWLSFFLLFVVKVPIFPFHSWLLNAHVEAPAVGSIILAALLLKFGIFGMMRYLLGLLHNISVDFSKFVIAMAIVSVFFSSICAISEPDIKKLVAYTSIAHMSLAVIGLFVFDIKGFYGSLITMIAHGIISTALFYLIGVLYSRVHTRNIFYHGGLVQLMPLFSTFLFFFAIANSGFPCSLGFIGEMFVLQGVFTTLGFKSIFVIIASLVMLLFANLRLFMFICFGTINTEFTPVSVTDINHLELYFLSSLTIHAFIFFYKFNTYFFALFVDCMGRHIFH